LHGFIFDELTNGQAEWAWATNSRRQCLL